MGDRKLNTDLIIEAYKNGESLISIGKRFGTYGTTIRRILIKNGIELRHDKKERGAYYVEDGEKLIEWAKAQGRLVTKEELAVIIGKKKLSHSYFEKYPELGQYVKSRDNYRLKDYTQKITTWLKENNIPYKPHDRKKLEGTSVDFLLLGEYSNIALQIMEKPNNISQTRYDEEMLAKRHKAEKLGIKIVFLMKEDIEYLDMLKDMLDIIKS